MNLPANRIYVVHRDDNVGTALDDLEAGRATLIGETSGQHSLAVSESVKEGHKVALHALAEGDVVRKFGIRIGHATRSISSGAWIHLHNMASDYDERAARLNVTTGALEEGPYQ